MIPLLVVLAILLLLGTGVAVASERVPFRSFFEASSRKWLVPVRLLLAHADVESGFRQDAVNDESAADRRKGRDVQSVGLMQILWPDTVQALRPGLTLEQAKQPNVNVDMGAQLVSELLRRFPVTEPSGFPADAVSAYNAGKPRRGPDEKYLNQAYVDRVRRSWEKFA